MSHPSYQQPSAPVMYPSDNIRPVPPVRSEFAHDSQEQALLSHRSPPMVPDRMDKPPTHSHADPRFTRNDNEENTGDINNDSTCNYNLYATRKTIGHGLLELALLTSNALQLRLLILQKQHDGIWIACLILVCVSILTQLGLAFLLYLLVKGDIRNSSKQSKLEQTNNFTLFLIVLISLINVVINMLMLTTNSKSFLDTHSLELLENKN